jgi:hypothetical protein
VIGMNMLTRQVYPHLTNTSLDNQKINNLNFGCFVALACKQRMGKKNQKYRLTYHGKKCHLSFDGVPEVSLSFGEIKIIEL